MEKRGWLSSRVQKIPGERNRPRRYYQLTDLDRHSRDYARLDQPPEVIAQKEGDEEVAEATIPTSTEDAKAQAVASFVRIPQEFLIPATDDPVPPQDRTARVSKIVMTDIQYHLISPATRRSQCRLAQHLTAAPTGIHAVAPWFAEQRLIGLSAVLEHLRPWNNCSHGTTAAMEQATTLDKK